MASSNLDIIIKVIDKASKDADKIAGSIRGISEAGKGITKLGGALSLGLTAPIVAAGAAVINSANEINAGLANVASLGVANVERYRDGIQAMSIAVGKNTEDLTTGLYQVVSAFGETSDTMTILGINARAAAAGLATTEQSIALTSAVTKAWGDTSAEAVKKSADLAFATVRLGQTTFPELAASIGRVTGMSKQLGISQEEMFAIFATGTGVIGTASEVSTRMAGTMSALIKPSEDLTAIYEEMGIVSGQALVEQQGLVGALQAVTAQADASGIGVEKLFGSTEALSFALAFSGAQAGTFADKLEAMNESSGAAASAFSAQTEGINSSAFAMKQLQMQVAVISQDIGEGLIPAMSAALAAITPLLMRVSEWANAFSALDPEMQKTISTVVLMAAALGPLLVGVGMVVSAVSTIAPAIGVVGAAIAALLSPIGLVIGAIVGLTAVIFNIGGAGDAAAAALEKIGFAGVAEDIRRVNISAAALVETLQQLAMGEMSLGDIEQPGWVADLMFWKWPELGVPGWVVTLMKWSWPTLAPVGWVIDLTAWSWPTLDKPGWLDSLLGWRWPLAGGGGSGGGGGEDNSAPGYSLPDLPSQLPYGAPVAPPSGFGYGRTAPAANTTNIVVNATVREGIDVEILANRIAALQRQSRALAF